MTNILDLIGRIMISAIFLFSGINKILNFNGAVVWMESYGILGILLIPAIFIEIIFPDKWSEFWISSIKSKCPIVKSSLLSSKETILPPDPIENLGMSFGFFIVTGFLVWQLFNDSLIDGIELLNYNKVFANSVTISNYSILLALIIFRLKFIFYHTFIMLILCFSYYGYFDILHIIPFLISIAIITLLGLGFGLCISPFAWFLGDLNKGLRLTLRPLMFVSGVVFPMGATSFSQYAESNPINILIDWSRLPFADTANMLIDVSAGLHFSLFISILLELSLMIFSKS